MNDFEEWINNDEPCPICAKRKEMKLMAQLIIVKDEVFSTSQEAMGSHPALWQAMRNYIFDKQEYICQKCMVKCEKWELTIDHIKAIGLGGKAYDLENIQTLCYSCHLKKNSVDNKEILKGYNTEEMKAWRKEEKERELREHPPTYNQQTGEWCCGYCANKIAKLSKKKQEEAKKLGMKGIV